MKTYELDNALGIVLPERIDSNSADTVKEEIQNLFDNKTLDHIFFDASELKYISSAGLRVILKFRKDDKELKIINVCSEVYEIFEMTGFTEILTIEKSYKQMSVDNCEIIGKGAKGTVYRYNSDTVLKVYNDSNCIDSIKNERNLAKKAFILGIPTAISFDLVKVGDKFATVYELLDADSFSGIMAKHPEKVEECSKMFADTISLIHSTKVDTDELPSAKKRYNKAWAVGIKALLDEETFNKVNKMLDEIPEPNNMLHCDYHTNNVMLQNDEPLVIDMDTLSYGHPLYDLGSIYFTYVSQTKYDSKSAEAFLNLDTNTIEKVWSYFLPQYLKSDDETYIKEVERKIMCFSNLRFINHLYRRSKDPQNDSVILEVVKEFKNQLMDIDSFVW